MKTLKAIINQWSKNSKIVRQITDQERCSLQSSLLEMLKDILKVCEDNHLCIMLGHGSCLGAIRHQGMIPWDDDIDLIMPRPDYDKLISILKSGVLSNDYDFRYPDGLSDCSSPFMKIYKKGTIFVGVNDNPSLLHSIFIDIFPIEGAPSNYVAQRIKGFFANFLRLIGNCTMEYQLDNSLIKKAMSENDELRKRMLRRRLVGWLFSFYSHKKWKYFFDRFVSDANMTRKVTMPTGRKLYNGELLDSSILFPVKWVQFYDIKAPIPNDWDKYLSNLYGDYMMIPSVENRESHFITELRL